MGADELRVKSGLSQLSFASEVFHKLSQPLTALHCWLELSLLRDRTPEEFRASVEAALQNTQRLRDALLLLRELSDADDAGDTSTPVPLPEVLTELQEDFHPIYESAGGRLEVHCAPLYVRANRIKLRRALFALLEHLLQNCGPRSVSINVERRKQSLAEIKISSHDGMPASSANDISQTIGGSEVDIARRTLRAVGGDLSASVTPSGNCIFLATLPLAV